MGMLNYETLLSSYDDKLTLMQWLKKVEAALKNASATSFVLNKKGNATISFSIVFEDGTSLESGDIVLQQGESVESAYIQNGNLHLVLTNGDDLDAGNMFNGNVTINGNFEVTGRAKLPNIEGDENNDINVDGNIVIADGGISIADGAVSTPILTSPNDEIEAQKSVVEVMNGYTFTTSTISNLSVTPIYVGAVKNGNKLTLVYFAKMTRTGDVGQGVSVGYFNVPVSIANKLYPFSVGGFDVISIDRVDAFQYLSSSKYVNMAIAKHATINGRLPVLIYSSSALDANVEYVVRLEATFLLSENLAA